MTTKTTKRGESQKFNRKVQEERVEAIYSINFSEMLSVIR